MNNKLKLNEEKQQQQKTDFKSDFAPTQAMAAEDIGPIVTVRHNRNLHKWIVRFQDGREELMTNVILKNVILKTNRVTMGSGCGAYDLYSGEAMGNLVMANARTNGNAQPLWFNKEISSTPQGGYIDPGFCSDNKPISKCDYLILADSQKPQAINPS